MTKLVQNDLTSLTNEQSALAALNANYALNEAFSDTVLSRDGSSPNHMTADLDMNSNNIINLPPPLTPTEPLRLQDLTSFVGGSLTVPTDAEFVAYTPASLTARSVEAKLLETISVKDFGVTGDGTTDDTVKIQTAINYLTNGGFLYFPPGTYKISNTLNINKTNVKLIGAGGDTYHDGGTGVDGSTKLSWFGGAAGTMVKFATVYNVTSSVISGVGMEGIELNGREIAGIGLLVDTVRGGQFKNLHVQDVTVDCYKTVCGITGTDVGEAADTQFCIFERCYFRVIDTAAVRSANGFNLTGSSNANTSFNTFTNCSGQYFNGAGYVLKNADNNRFIGCSAFDAGGTGFTFDCWAPNATGGGPVGGECNFFISCGWDATDGIKFRGTEQAGSSAALLINQIIGTDRGNSASQPTLGTGSNFLQAVYGRSSYLWSTYTPTFTSAGGTLGTTTINRARFMQIEKTVHIYIDVTITSAGAAPTGDVRFTLPVVAVNAQAGTVNGREAVVSNNLIGGVIDGTNSRGTISFNAGATPTGNGNRLIFGGTYEAV